MTVPSPLNQWTTVESLFNLWTTFLSASRWKVVRTSLMSSLLTTAPTPPCHWAADPTPRTTRTAAPTHPTTWATVRTAPGTVATTTRRMTARIHLHPICPPLRGPRRSINHLGDMTQVVGGLHLYRRRVRRQDDTPLPPPHLYFYRYWLMIHDAQCLRR